MTARDAIAAFLKVRDENVRPDECDDQERAASADEIISELAAAGFSIVPTGEGVADAVEVGASAIERIDFPRGLRPFGITGRRIIAEAVLTAAAPHMPVKGGA